MTQKILFFLTQITLILSNPLLRATDCRIALNNLDPEPIAVSSIDYDFLYPEPDVTSISIPHDSTIVIACPGGSLSADAINSNTAIWATCDTGIQFYHEDQPFNFNTIQCSKKPVHTARYTGENCEKKGKEIEIGFVMNENVFVRLIQICFDTDSLMALYAAFDITGSIIHHEGNVPRPSFTEDDFYNLGVKVNDLYTKQVQQVTINGLLGLPESSTKFIQNSTNYFLSRGHLAAKADFVYAPQQSATFHFVNVAPQWQTVNSLNWNQIEMDTRSYVEDNGIELVNYIGVYGVTTLPHEETGEETPLYLYLDENGNTALPIPELFWKVVYSTETKQGVVFISLNNPFQTDVERSIICEDVSSQITWINWKRRENIEAGYSYACTIPDFRKAVDYLPDFEVTGLLL